MGSFITSTSITPAEAKAKVHQDLQEMSSMTKQQALEFTLTNLILDIIVYYEAVMGQLGGVLNFIAEMEEDMFEIQSDFNKSNAYMKQYNDYWMKWFSAKLNGNQQQQTEYENDMVNLQKEQFKNAIKPAIDAATDIMNLMQSSTYDSIRSSVEEQLSDVFGGNAFYTKNKDGTFSPNYNNAINTNPNTVMTFSGDIADTWCAAWENTDGGNTGGYQVPNQYEQYMVAFCKWPPSTSLQPITDAFNSLGTDFSSVSNTTQNELQYYEGDDQEMQGMEKTLSQDNQDLVSTIGRNQKA